MQNRIHVCAVAVAIFGAACHGELGGGGQRGANDTSSDASVDSDGGAASSIDGGAASSIDGGASLCGNGVLDPGEQCDDGNTINLDGCDATCLFEQDQRINSLKMQFTTDSLCAANALGQAILSPAQSQVQTAIDAAVKSGTNTVLVKMIGLTDLTGTAASSVTLGALGGTPVAGTGYDGSNDLDWWYTADPTTIDQNRNPIGQLAGTIANSVLTAGPGALAVKLALTGQPALIHVSNARMQVTVNSSATAPTVSTSGAPPGHLPSENLDPALVSYPSSGTASAPGELCGDMSALSLAGVPIPAQLISTCSNVSFTAQNSFLDALVVGCSTVFGIVQLIKPAQPDAVDPAAPVAGTGGPYTLAVDGNHHVVSCADQSGAAVDLTACLTAGAYSSFFKFTSDRVIIK